MCLGAILVIGVGEFLQNLHSGTSMFVNASKQSRGALKNCLSKPDFVQKFW